VKTEYLYGFHPVAEALKAGRRRIDEIIFDRRKAGPRIGALREAAERRRIPVKTAQAGRIAVLAASDQHQGVVARVGPYPYTSPEALLASAADRPAGGSYLLVLDGIVDPQNLGAILRTALCAGVDGVVVPKDRSAAATAAVSKVSAGALEHVRLARATNLVRSVRQMKAGGLWIIGLDGGAQQDFFALDATGPLAIVVGGEAKGLRPLLKKHCDFTAAIPMAGPLDSLNAGAASAVALFEVFRQRRAVCSRPEHC